MTCLTHHIVKFFVLRWRFYFTRPDYLYWSTVFKILTFVFDIYLYLPITWQLLLRKTSYLTTQKLIIFCAVKPMSLGILRSDVMLESTCRENIDDVYCCWKQVEINAIASGFGWLGPASKVIHRLESEETLQIFCLSSWLCQMFRELWM